MEVLLSNIVKYIKDYALDNDERTMFDWLVIKQHDFGVSKPFRHSISQIEEATLLSKYLQNRILGKFKELGFLTVGKEFYQNNPYRSFFIDYSILTNPEVLGKIVREGTETYSNLLALFKEWAKEQAQSRKPATKKQQKAAEDKSKATDALYICLNAKWDERRQMYNNGELTGKKPKRGKSKTSLPKSKNVVMLLGKLLDVYEQQAISNAFTAFSDAVLKDEVRCSAPLSYFLKCEGGDFPVVNQNLDNFNTQYSYNNE